MKRKIMSSMLKGALGGVFLVGIMLGMIVFMMGLDSYKYYSDIYEPVAAVLIIMGLVFGGLVGIYFGINNMKIDKARLEAENSKNAKKWASELKQDALKVSQVCAKNKLIDTQLVSVKYKANDQAQKIINGFLNVAKLQGEIVGLYENESRDYNDDN